MKSGAVTLPAPRYSAIIRASDAVQRWPIRSVESGSWCSRRNLTRHNASALDKLDRAQNLNYLERGSEHHLGGETAKPSARAIAIVLMNRQV